jgi:hypothetical protein
MASAARSDAMIEITAATTPELTIPAIAGASFVTAANLKHRRHPFNDKAHLAARSRL